MKTTTLPKRVFNSPLVEYANFTDGSHLNLIKLTKPYSDGIAYAIHSTSKNTLCSNGLFRSFKAAKEKFEKMVSIAREEVDLKDKSTIYH
jgi:hypothetical protein